MPSATYKPQPMTAERTAKAHQHLNRTRYNGLVPDVYFYYLVDALAEIDRLRTELAAAEKRGFEAGREVGQAWGHYQAQWDSFVG